MGMITISQALWLIAAFVIVYGFCWCLARSAGRADHVDDSLSGALESDLTNFVASLNKKDAA